VEGKGWWNGNLYISLNEITLLRLNRTSGHIESAVSIKVIRKALFRQRGLGGNGRLHQDSYFEREEGYWFKNFMDVQHRVMGGPSMIL